MALRLNKNHSFPLLNRTLWIILRKTLFNFFIKPRVNLDLIIKNFTPENILKLLIFHSFRNLTQKIHVVIRQHIISFHFLRKPKRSISEIFIKRVRSRWLKPFYQIFPFFQKPIELLIIISLDSLIPMRKPIIVVSPVTPKISKFFSDFSEYSVLNGF